MDPRRLTYLVVVAALGALVFWSFSRPGWETQLRATSSALQSAHSWEMSARVRSPGQPTHESREEVSCPGEYHSISHPLTETGNPDIDNEHEIWTSGGKSTVRVRNQVIPMPLDTASGCGQMHMLDLGQLPPMQMILAVGHAERKSKKSIDGQSCRVWTVQMPKGDGWGDIFDLCIGDDNLPLELIATDGSVIAHASHWNGSVAVAPPPASTATAD